MFKEILDKDLDVFVNIEEFGEESSINGTTIIVVEDNDGVKEYKNNNVDLLYEDLLMLYCKVQDLDSINIDNYLDYNGMFYTILAKDKQGGIYQIVLKRSTQGSIKEWF